MSYNGSGVFNINSAGQPVVTGTVISSTAFNALTSDLATGLSTAITKDGQTTPTANIPMGGFTITGLGAGVSGTDAANLSQVQSSSGTFLTVTGTNTIAASVSPSLTAYSSGQMFGFTAAGTNTGATTINISSLGAKSIVTPAGALNANNIISGYFYIIYYDGVNFQLLNPTPVGLPAFSAYASANTIIASATYTKVLFAFENFDTNNNFASSRFTPTVAGYYQINSGVYVYTSGAGSTVRGMAIYKNGSVNASGSFYAGVIPSDTLMTVSQIIYFNGTTDYVEIYVTDNGTSPTIYGNGGSSNVYFSGAMIRSA